jgi:hypothetical protein
MPASKAEQVLDALKALLETVPDAVVERNSVLPEKIPAGGLVTHGNGALLAQVVLTRGSASPTTLRVRAPMPG